MNHLTELLNMLHCPMVFFTNKGTCFAGFLSGFDSTQRKIVITNFHDIKKNTYHRGQSWSDITAMGGVMFERVEVAIDEIKDLHLLNETRNQKPYYHHQQSNYNYNYRTNSNNSNNNNNRNYSSYNLPVQREVNRNIRGQFLSGGNNRYLIRQQSNPSNFNKSPSQFNSAKTFLNISSDELKNDYDIEKHNSEFLKVFDDQNSSENNVNNSSSVSASPFYDAKNIENNIDDSNFYDHISSSATIEHKRSSMQGQTSKFVRQRRINSIGRRNSTIGCDGVEVGGSGGGVGASAGGGGIRNSNNNNKYNAFDSRRHFLLKTGNPGQDFINQKSN